MYMHADVSSYTKIIGITLEHYVRIRFLKCDQYYIFHSIPMQGIQIPMQDFVNVTLLLIIRPPEVFCLWSVIICNDH